MPEPASYQPAPGVTPALDVPAPVSEAAQGPAIESRGQFRLALERFAHHRLALASLIVFVLLLLMSTIGPLFWHYSYTAITNQFATAPSAQHPFGTDLIGHDLFAQAMEAEATSIKTALLVAVIATTVGTTIGAAAGYYGKLADALLMRFTDLILAVPLLAILLVLANRLSKQAGSWFWIALILGFVLWTNLARQVRGSFLSLREREFVEAEHAIGASDRRIIFRHMIPNAIGPIIVSATLDGRAGDPYRGGAVLPRPGHPAARGVPGQPDRQRPGRGDDAALAVLLPRGSPRAHDSHGQLHR